MGERAVPRHTAVPATDRGSVLMLMPAAVLVVVILGALAVDAALVFLGERELSNVAAAAANDAATQGIDVAHLYGDGRIVIDPARVREVAERAVRAQEAPWLRDMEVEVDVRQGDDPAVTVVVRGRVRPVFARAVPGGPDLVAVDASATATARRR